MFFRKLIQILKFKELRNKILVVLAIFALFRVMANIPIPGVDVERLKLFFEQFQVFGLLNVFTGGSLDQLSIVMLGVGPYITATIVLQLLTMIFPALEKMYKEEGEAGRQKFNQYGRFLTFPFALLQGYGMLTLLERQQVIEALSPLALSSSILTIAAGTLFLMWLGEIISQKGIGNGISLLIFAGIISGFPQSLWQSYLQLKFDPSRLLSFSLFFLAALLIIFGVTWMTEARRNIPISYARRVRGRKMYGGTSTYLPMNVNPAGVIPIIFALSVLTLPGMIANFFLGTSGFLGEVAQKMTFFFADPVIYGLLYFVLILLFTFFYTLVVFDPSSIASNLQKMGGFIPGIRPGSSTTRFLQYTLNRILPIGAIFLGTIALSPSLIGGLTGVQAFQFLIGGTSLLILVSVVLETYREIRGYLEMREI